MSEEPNKTLKAIAKGLTEACVKASGATDKEAEKIRKSYFGKAQSAAEEAYAAGKASCESR